MGQNNAKGTVGTDLDVSITLGNKRLREMIISAPLANDDATLVIYDTTKSTPTRIFNGYLANRDSNGAIKFKDGKGSDDTTKFIVAVTGGTGNLFVNAIYD